MNLRLLFVGLSSNILLIAINDLQMEEFSIFRNVPTAENPSKVVSLQDLIPGGINIIFAPILNANAWGNSDLRNASTQEGLNTNQSQDGHTQNTTGATATSSNANQMHQWLDQKTIMEMIQRQMSDWTNKVSQTQSMENDQKVENVGGGGSLLPTIAPWRLFGMTALGSYVVFAYHIFTRQKYFANPRRWCNWRRQTWDTYDWRKESVYQEWITALATSIHAHHMNQENPFDVVKPAAQFLKEIEKEHNQLYNYLYLTRLLQRCWLSPFFPISKVAQKNAQKRLKHIGRVYRLFLASLRQKEAYQIAQPTPYAVPPISARPLRSLQSCGI